MKNKMQNEGWKNKNFVVENFPYSEKDNEAWIEVFGDEIHIKRVFVLGCNEQTSVQRIMRRVRVNRSNYESEKTIQGKISHYEERKAKILENFDKAIIKPINADRILKRVTADIVEYV